VGKYDKDVGKNLRRGVGDEEGGGEEKNIDGEGITVGS